MDWSPRRTQNCHSDPGWDWELYADIRGRTHSPFNYLASQQQKSSASNFPTVCPWKYEYCFITFDPEKDTLQDYQEMFIQFGYVVLFSSAFPLAAMCALVNNIIEIRSDALKLCTGLQRPFGQRVENIGQWQVSVFCSGKCQGSLPGLVVHSGGIWSDETVLLSLSFSRHQTAMEAMGLIAIIVNCYLIGQCGQLQRLFPWLSPEMTIISIVLLEVCFLLCSVNAGLSMKGFVVLRKM